jgi:glycosyltransferase involved in cell wall biosynthesis
MASTNLKTLPKGPAPVGQVKASKGPWSKGFIVVAVVPAHDEVHYIDHVAKQLNQRRREGLIHEVVVVNDGSTDKTATHAKNWEATVLEMPKNRGKATAVAVGARYVSYKYVPKTQFPPGKKRYDKMEKVIVVMIDADMGNLSKEHIHGLVDPIIRDHELNMTVGTLEPHKKYIMDNNLSGQRGIRLRSLGAMIDETRAWKDLLRHGYGLETALNRYIKSFQFTKIKFDTKRAPGEKAGERLHREVHSTAKYLNARKTRANALNAKRAGKQPQKKPPHTKHRR